MQWDLKVLFESEAACEQSAQQLLAEAEAFNTAFAGRLEELSAAEFVEALKELERLEEWLARVESYAGLSFSLDTTRGAFLAKFEELANDISQQLLFFAIEFTKLGEEKRAEFTNADERFCYFLQNLAKQKPYTLSQEVESVLVKVGNVGKNSWSRLFDETLSSAKFEFDGKFLGEEELLAKLHHPQSKVRKEASESLSKTLTQHSHLLTFIFNMIRRDLKNSYELRGYETPESSRHISNQISKSSVDALIGAVEERFNISKEYYALKREILGVEELFDYDRYAPFEASGEEFSFEEAKGIVLEAFGRFSPIFESLAREAFDGGWIDAMPKQNKQGGAFSHSAVSSAHPFVLLNFTNNRRDIFTLAHELGHAIHQKLAYSVGYFNSHTPLVTAETASVFCEMLTFDYIFNKTAEKKERQALLGGKIEDIFATLFRQINFTTFEREIHAREGELNSEELGEIWLKHSKKMFEGSLTLTPNYKICYSYIPHFIHTPFYCYAYSYAQLLVLALFGLYKNGQFRDFISLYVEFLSAGGSRSPQELVAKFGFDLNSSEFWQIGLDYVASLVEEFRKLR